MAEPTRREREQTRRRKEILAAALSAFARSGYQGTTMAEICRTSEYPLGTIYRFFESKEQIYRELLVEWAQGLADRLREIVRDEDLPPVDRLRALYRAKADYFSETRDYLLLFLAERSQVETSFLQNDGRSESVQGKLDMIYKELIELYAALFEKGISQGQFRSFPSMEMAVQFSGMANTIAMHWLRSGGDREQLLRQMNNAFSILTGGICIHES